MSKKKKMQKLDLSDFFQTNSEDGFKLFEEGEAPEEQPVLEPQKQKILVRKEKKGRGGKVVTLVEGFVGPEEDLNDLAKKIKQHCGVGGTMKNGVVVIQGDLAEKVTRFLVKSGYPAKKTTV